IFFLYVDGLHRDLPSFPTRRSSDLFRRTPSRKGCVACRAARRSRASSVTAGGRGAGQRRPTCAGKGVRAKVTEPHAPPSGPPPRSEEHTSELQSQSNLVCRLLLEKK